MDIQSSIFDNNKKINIPLSERMRPRDFDEFTGQEHLLSEKGLLRQLIESKNIPSMVFWGPPGVGKTTLAMIISKKVDAKFLNFSAVMSGIGEIKEVMKEAQENKRFGVRTILFVDEIHRFNKAQQDAFLPYVERGDIILIGATTENPSFELNSALLSRLKVFVLNPLREEDIVKILKKALKDEERGLGRYKIKLDEELLYRIASFSNGDARVALNTLELAFLKATIADDGTYNITVKEIEDAFQKKVLLYDKKGEEHYNLISALHKSIRNSDVDATLYWLARMIESGEDPLYIARRLIRVASEDVGLADPEALVITVSAFQAVQFVGLPEAALNLAQAAVYLALCPKSNALYTAYNKAREDAINNFSEPVPLHLRNAPTPLMKELGYGKGYKYAHDYKEKVADMECLPKNIKGTRYYFPTDQGKEKFYAERLKEIENLKKKYKN
ncbi:replication-associated recombination protein A [Thermovenabulum sp.]|uniref:replication-associated recombination protein A n=1 Tax=Thermovenabulum sp. TaxID=3100335 RepID=UPI003C7AE5FE